MFFLYNHQCYFLIKYLIAIFLGVVWSNTFDFLFLLKKIISVAANWLVFLLTEEKLIESWKAAAVAGDAEIKNSSDWISFGWSITVKGKEEDECGRQRVYEVINYLVMLPPKQMMLEVLYTWIKICCNYTTWKPYQTCFINQMYMFKRI